MTIFSGCVIAVLYFKALKKQRFYFGIYPLGVVIFLFGYIFRGVLGGILMSVTMMAVVADDVAFQQENITVYTKYTGFFSRCCTYGIYENSYGVFERLYGEFKVQGSDLRIKNLQNTSEILKLTYEDYVYDSIAKNLILKDVTIIYQK